jgi:tRNA(Arg) A34 adenosine deaminase TadA
MYQPDENIMKKAIKLAREKYKEGGHAVAAIIVKNNVVVSEAFTSVRRDQDPTAHAEINAIRMAAKKLGNKLIDCYLYTTYEPCPMCSSAAIWAKMKGIIYGASREDRTDACPWRVLIPAEEVIKQGTPILELYPEFMREECKKLLTLQI